MEKVRIDFAPGFRSTAMLLSGWLGAQFNWRVDKSNEGNTLKAIDARGREIKFELREIGQVPIGKVVLNSSETEFVVSHAECGDLLEVWRSGQNEKPRPQMVPAQNNDPVSLLSTELMRGGPHRVYLHAVSCVRALL